jgi:glyoxylase-like metal-dependent hydrolase (beta-lactamase superfamily II)
MNIHRLVFSPISVNTYILEDGSGECAVIDCGCYDRSEFATLVDFFMEKKLKPVLLLNTHCHLDHVFGNGFMLEKYGLRTLSGEPDEKNRRNATHHAMIFGLEMQEPPEPESFLTDGQEIRFNNIAFRSIHVPGHSPGSMAFYFETEKVVFTGDALFAGSIGRTDLPGGMHETLLESIRQKLLVLPPETIVYPGHGESTDIGTEMRTNPWLK